MTEFDKRFSKENLIKTYEKIKKKKLPTGIDRINKTHFGKIYEDCLTIAHTKIIKSSYIPTPYKEVLLIKNSNSLPRKLSLPSIKDKVILEVLRIILNDNFNPIIKEKKVTEVIEQISKKLLADNYNSFIKIDIKGYYDSINHRILISKLEKLNLDKKTISLIKKYLKNITVAEGTPTNKQDRINKIGIPQGISISNVLGNIYLNDFDFQYYNKNGFAYFRYVDDIIILCNQNNIDYIKNEILNELSSTSYKLKISKNKTIFGNLNEFDFLGYHFNNKGTIGIADKNIKKIELSLEKLFSDYYSSRDKKIKKNIDLLKWKIDLKITGCFANSRRYGWVIFFCQNQNETIFHELDWYIEKLCKRFGLEKELLYNNSKYIGKSFVKTYYEFINKKENTNYIPNIDMYTQNQKKDVLIKICKRKVEWINSQPNYIIDLEFNKFIFNSIRDIEKDLYQIYT